jgi:Flp pilus assembly pilin Flp
MTSTIRLARRGRLRNERGQTFTEYLMIAGLLTAIIIAMTQIIAPGIANPIVRLVRHMTLYVSGV